MKTYTLEELRLAQAKGCRIEAFSASGWHLVIEPNFKLPLKDYRIHPADEWKARLPRLKEGAEWVYNGQEVPDGWRPYIKGESLHSDVFAGMIGVVTPSPVPPEFLHPDELAEAQTCAIQHNQENAKNLRDPKGFCKVCGTDWPEAAPAPAATPTDTPETDALRESYVHLGPNWLAFEVFAKASERFERRARAAEARLAKWESELSKVMPQDFKDWWQNSREEWPEIARMVIEGLRKQVKMTDTAAEARVKELEADLNEAIEGRKYNSDCINRRAIERDEARADLHKARAALRLRPVAEAGPVPEGMIRLHAHRIPLGPPGAEFWSAFSEPGEEDTHCVDIYPPQQ